MMAEKMLCMLILVLFSSNLVLGPPMDPLRASVTNEEQWAFIKLHVLLSDSAAEVYRLLHKSVKSLALSERQVMRLYNEFANGERTSTQRQPGQGRPRTATDDCMKEQLKNLLEEDNDWGTEDYARQLNIGSTSVKTFSELGARKIAARWVPHELTAGQ